MIRRASESDAGFGRHHLHGDVAKRARFDRTGNDGPASRVGGELISNRLREPPPTIRISVMAVPVSSSIDSDNAVLEREALEDGARVSRWALGLGLPRLATIVGDRRDHAARMKKGRMVGVKERAEGRARLAREREQLLREMEPLLGPVATACLQQPQAAMFFSSRVVP